MDSSQYTQLTMPLVEDYRRQDLIKENFCYKCMFYEVCDRDRTTPRPQECEDYLNLFEQPYKIIKIVGE
jgi:hypothetical protein